MPTFLFWRDSVLWVALMSLYANIVGHWGAYQAARAEESAEEKEVKMTCTAQDGDGEMDRARNLENREGGGVHFTALEARKPETDTPVFDVDGQRWIALSAVELMIFRRLAPHLVREINGDLCGPQDMVRRMGTARKEE